MDDHILRFARTAEVAAAHRREVDILRELHAFLPTRPGTFTPVLVHRDLAPEHILVDDAGRVVGLIDLEDSAVGEPAITAATITTLRDRLR